MVPYIDIEPIVIGDYEIHAFDILVGLAVILGAWVGYRRAKKVGLDPWVITDVALWAVLAGFIGSHVFSVVFYFPERLAENPLHIFEFWSGMSSFGGFVGGALGAILYFRIKKIPVWPYSDPVLYGLMFGWILGRLGCTVAHDHRGLPSDFFLAVNMPARDGYAAGPRHDLGFYEFLFTVALFAAFFFTRNKERKVGWHLMTILLAYAPIRFYWDFLRTADKRYFGLTAGQYVAIAFLLIGVWVWYQRRSFTEVLVPDGKPHKRPKAATRK